MITSFFVIGNVKYFACIRRPRCQTGGKKLKARLSGQAVW